MSWRQWAEQLRQSPKAAVSALLRGSADISPFARVEAHEFLLAVLPRSCRLVNQPLFGEPASSREDGECADLPALLDIGLHDWLLEQRQSAPPPARRLSAYAAQVCEALQWPLYFQLPTTLAALRQHGGAWRSWCASLTISAFRDPEYDYWQVLAAQPSDDHLQFFWRSCVLDAGRSRSLRYLNLGLLALARLPLREDDALRNLRLQVQVLLDRYQQRQHWGVPALEALGEQLGEVLARNADLSPGQTLAFLRATLGGLGDHKVNSLLSLLGLQKTEVRGGGRAEYQLMPPGSAQETKHVVQVVRRASHLGQAWQAISPLLVAHEAYVHSTGRAYDFVRALDECARALCKHFSLTDPDIRAQLFEWIQLALRLDAANPRLWMLWELALRQAGQPQRAQWVLWEMTCRFPEQLPCRVELARLLANSADADALAQAHRLLQQILALEPDNIHAHSTLAQLAIRHQDWPLALQHAQHGLRVKPDHEPSAVLLATAYARRKAAGDLDAAIEHLQRFVRRYPGNPKAEGYLGDLLRRQARGGEGPLTEEAPLTAPSTAAETDPLWLAFAHSMQAAPAPAASSEAGRLPVLAQALRQAAAAAAWATPLLTRYDAASQRQLPLETALWRYLHALANQADAAILASEQQAVQQQLALEKNTQHANDTWPLYLAQHWAELCSGGNAALAAGQVFLTELLDRYRPLPAPLLQD
ncbi:MAG: hypothetical protein RI925_2458 [Pseudomonadota bacterium]|jgi:tetratricopeptide (TPR) repeat protein